MRGAASLLGDCLGAPCCLTNPALGWSPGEPAVNVYAAGALNPHPKRAVNVCAMLPLSARSLPVACMCSAHSSSGEPSPKPSQAASSSRTRTSKHSPCSCRSPAAALPSKEVAPPSGGRASGPTRTRTASATCVAHRPSRLPRPPGPRYSSGGRPRTLRSR